MFYRCASAALSSAALCAFSMLNTYKDCKASFCSSLSVSHLSKRTFLLFLLFLFYFTYLNAFFFHFFFSNLPLLPPSFCVFPFCPFSPLLFQLVIHTLQNSESQVTVFQASTWDFSSGFLSLYKLHTRT